MILNLPLAQTVSTTGWHWILAQICSLPHIVFVIRQSHNFAKLNLLFYSGKPLVWLLVLRQHLTFEVWFLLLNEKKLLISQSKVFKKNNWGVLNLRYRIRTRCRKSQTIPRPILKAAIINIFILVVDQMTICNVKVVNDSDEPTENYYPTLKFPSAVRSILLSLSSLFWFYGPHCLPCAKQQTKLVTSWWTQWSI